MMHKKNLIHIGTNILVSLPSEAINGVKAKVDTGADSSAIWASDIKEVGDEITFKLFGKESPHYTGNIIKTKQYRVIEVKNSFGDTELRYKLKLKLTIAGRKINSSFTLANRGNNSYSILIGKRTLRGKFLIDVSQKQKKA